MRVSWKVLRYLVAAVTFGLWSGTEAPAAQTAWCYEICDSQSACDTSCLVDSDPAFQSTCGMYSGGAGSGWCAGSCEPLCLADTAGGTACYDPENNYSSCGAFGVYLQCGDDVCAGGETSTTCSADCGEALFIPDDETEFETFGEFVEELDSQGALDGSAESAVIAAQAACSYGYIDSEFCPTMGPEDFGLGPDSELAGPAVLLAEGSGARGVFDACASARRWGKVGGAALIITGIAGAVATLASGPIVYVAAGTMAAWGGFSFWSLAYASARAIQCIYYTAPEVIVDTRRRPIGMTPAPALSN